VSSELSRRSFLARTVFSGAALALGGVEVAARAAESSDARRFEFVGFTKPFQKLNFEDTADLVAEVGWDGIECPVRANGQILPERVEEDLPRMVEALRKRKLRLAVMATDIVNTTNPLTEKVLRTAKKLGIGHYRLGFMHYRAEQEIPRQLEEIRSRMRDLAALNRELGMCGGIQNHSGRDNVGAPVWDVYELIKDLDPRYLSIFFDIGHATLEGGYSWPLNARLMQPYLGAVYVKDFYWQKGADGWKSRWCPLGEGMVQRQFFEALVKSPYHGVVCQHCEYEMGDGTERLAAMRKDLKTLRQLLNA
jgi:sugar phosphate isomerase/epimerase